MKKLAEKYREKRKELHVAFMDLEKVYDKVYRGCCMNVELMGAWLKTGVGKSKV